MKIHDLEVTGSLIYNGVNLLSLTSSVTDSGSFSAQIVNLNQVSSSLNSFTSSINTTIKNKLDSESVISGSAQVLITGTTGYSTFSSSISSSIGDLSSSVATTTSGLSSSIGSLSGSVATTTSGLASRIGSVETKTGSYATTGSNVFIGSQVITGSICSTGDIVTTGQIVAQTINVQQVTSSIVYSCGSNIFGNILSNTQQFTGSILATGSLTLTGPMIGSSTVCGVMANFSCIGIGTSSPSARLHTEVAVEGVATGAVALIAKTSNGVNDIFRWFDGSTQLGVFKNNGNVGIGTSSPCSTFDVVVGASGTRRLLVNYDDSVITVKAASNTTAPEALRLIGDNIRFNVGTTGSGTEAMRFTGTGIACFACQVCSPNHIASSTCSTAGLRVYGASGTHQWDMYLNGANLRFSDNTSGGCLVVDTAATFSNTITAGGDISVNAGSSLRVYRSDSSYPSASWFWNMCMDSSNLLSFAVNGGTPKLTINASGYVGIGLSTSSARSILEVSKTTGNTSIGVASNTSLLLSQGGTTSELSQIGFGYTQTTSPAVIGGITTDVAAYTKVALIFATRDVTSDTAPTERMRIDSAGTVQVKSGNELRVYRSDNTRYGTFYNDNSNVHIAASTDPIRISSITRTEFYVSGTEQMRITSGGSVSIGSTSTPYNFNVYGAANSDGFGAFFGAAGTTKGGIYIGNAGNQYGTLYFDNANNNVYLKQSYTSGCVIVITNTGGVYLANGGTSWTAISSDERKKKNFETTQGLAEVLQIEPIKYHFNEDDNNSTKRLGFKAQNIQPLIPEMVLETGEFAEDGSPYLTITSDYILPVLVKAIQEQQSTICSQSQKIAILETCLGIM